MRVLSCVAAVGVLTACSDKPAPPPEATPQATADRIVREFEAFCLQPLGDAAKMEAALTKAGWVEPTRGRALRGFEERLSGNRMGEGLAMFDQQSCVVSRSSPKPDAVADILGRDLARRYGGKAAMADPYDVFCTTAPAGRGAIYKACHWVYPDAPATASLEVVWPDGFAPGATPAKDAPL